VKTLLIAGVIALVAAPAANADTSHKGWPKFQTKPWINKADRDTEHHGGEKNDEILGGHGDDVLFGEGGRDVLWGDYKPSGQGTAQRDTLDSGAGNVDVVTPVDTLIRAWTRAHGVADITLIVAHSHGHGDHVAGDSLFRLRPGTIVVGRDTASVRTFFGIRNWPSDTATFDLGGRVLDILPIPGHQAASIAVYDRRTGIPDRTRHRRCDHGARRDTAGLGHHADLCAGPALSRRCRGPDVDRPRRPAAHRQGDAGFRPVS